MKNNHYKIKYRNLKEIILKKKHEKNRKLRENILATKREIVLLLINNMIQSTILNIIIFLNILHLHLLYKYKSIINMKFIQCSRFKYEIFL